MKNLAKTWLKTPCAVAMAALFFYSLKLQAVHVSFKPTSIKSVEKWRDLPGGQYVLGLARDLNGSYVPIAIYDKTMRKAFVTILDQSFFLALSVSATVSQSSWKKPPLLKTNAAKGGSFYERYAFMRRGTKTVRLIPRLVEGRPPLLQAACVTPRCNFTSRDHASRSGLERLP